MRRRASLTAVALVATATATIGPLASGPVQAADPPADFTDVAVASFSSPTAVEWLPGNRIAVLEKSGRLRVGRPGGSFTTAIDLAVCSNSERGLLGLAPDPGFLSNGWVYVYYTRNGPGGCVNRVSRFTMGGDRVVPSSEIVLLDNIASAGGNHNGGDLDVGSDGNIYVAIGDSGTDPRGNSGSAGGNDAAQDLSLLNGKIVRITRSGTPAAGNPFTGAGTVRCAQLGVSASPSVRCREIYAWGLRNPYRFAFDRDDGSDRFYINDVGQSTYEEVDRGAIGNFGWPTREGPCPQGQTVPCPASPSGVIDPITSYGRSLGTYITAGAFVPDGLWPERFDGAYLFGDGGSGRIWMMDASGSVDYGSPFATSAFGLTDMTFGFDASGRMVLYYVQVGGSLRMIVPNSVPAGPTAADLRMDPITPIRAYDTGDGTGVPGGAAGHVVNASTRVVDLDPPANARAALVNITMAGTAGSGFVRTWASRTLRPVTSSVNADGAGSTVGNAVIVPLASDGTFVLESATTTRVVVDVMAWFRTTGGASDDGRFVALDPARLVDTREPAGSTLDSGSSNPYARSGNLNPVEATGRLGVDPDETGAVVLSIAALPTPGRQGRATLVPGGAGDSGTSSVNVTPSDIRNNLVVVPVSADGEVDIITKDLDDVVIDLLGYVTSPSAPSSGSGLYTQLAASRIVDSRDDLGFGRLAARTPATLNVPGASGASAVVQTVTVTGPSGQGWIVAHPSVAPPVVSNLNFGAGDTRGTLAFTRLTNTGRERFTARVPTDVVVDRVGFFSD